MRLSRNASTKAIALLSAALLAVGGIIIPAPTDAAIPDDSLTTQHGDNLGAGPEAKITLDTDKTEVKPGDTVAAHVEIEGTVPFPEVGQWRYGESDATAVIFSLQIDPRLTVNDVDKLQFKWADGKERKPFNVQIDAESNVIAFEFASSDVPLGPEPKMTVDIPVTVNDDVQDGDELGVKVATEVDLRPTLDWTYDNWEMRSTGDPCLREAVGELTFDNPGRYGTWLADFWLGTNSEYFELEGQPEITVRGPGGEDMTDQVFQDSSYPQVTHNPTDRPKIFTGADGKDFSNYRWLSQSEWKINEQGMAGDVWIPEGSTIFVKQLVRSSRCSFDPDREDFGAKVESRNTPLYRQDVDEAVLTVKKDPEPEPKPSPTTSGSSSSPSSTVTETEKVCKPSESEGGQPSEPVEPTPGDDGVVTVTTTVVDPEGEDCGSDPEPEPSPTTSGSSSSPSSTVTETEKVCKPSESEGGQPSEPVEPTPGDDGVVTVTTTVVDPEGEDCGSDPEPEPEPKPSPTTSGSSSSPSSTVTETEKVCKPSESEGGQPSEPVEPTPGDDGVVTVTTTVVDPDDPNCPSGGGDEPTPAPSEDPDPTPTNPEKSSKSSLGWLLVPLIPLLSSGKSSAVPSGKPVPHSSVPSTDEKRLEEKPQKEADNVLEDTHQDGETNPHGPTEKAPLVAKPTSTQGTPTAHTERFTGLANTGASVLGLVLCGLAALAAGLFLVRRNRKSTES
ncbi:hypothetical protein [Corynebacterium marquesiae]|uniref:hypothetical protein n=1 Tax=Corynebacterium marquesiae TaxID=2913503 RepID=UPI0038CF5906